METPERVVNLLGRKSLEIDLQGQTGTNNAFVNGSPERHQTRLNNSPNDEPNSKQSPTSSSASGRQRFEVLPVTDAGKAKVRC